MAGVTCVTKQISAMVGLSPWQKTPLRLMYAASPHELVI